MLEKDASPTLVLIPQTGTKRSKTRDSVRKSITGEITGTEAFDVYFGKEIYIFGSFKAAKMEAKLE